MSHQNIYDFINENTINREVRASYNSSNYIIDYIPNNYLNELHNVIDRYYINIINYELNTDIADPISFTSDPKFIGEQCSICWDNVETVETMAVTKCSTKPHIFHKSCILSWTTKSSSCPNCRCPL
jgi:hypothetical protein